MNDLWALGLAHLPALSHAEMLTNDNAALAGRTLEPWRAILATALWLDDQGAKGLFKRMNALSLAYQKERPDFESGDLTQLTVKALLRCMKTSVSSVSSVASIKKGESVKCWTLKTKDITEAAKAVVTEEELDMDPERLTSRRLGRVLGRLRLEKNSDTSKRAWLVKETDLDRLSLAFGLVDSGKADPSLFNACHAFNAYNACPDGLNGYRDTDISAADECETARMLPGETPIAYCQRCYKPDIMTGNGPVCRLSAEDRARRAERLEVFARETAEDMSAEERAAWEARLDPEGDTGR